MTSVFLGLGGNLGDRRANVREAAARLREILNEVRVSSLYESEAWGVTDQPAFLNAVVRGTTTLEPLELLDRIQAVEDAMGRVRTRHWGPRVIDIDILLYGKAVVDHERLQIPHPYLSQRSFVLRPLADLAAGLTLPDGSLVGELLTTVPQDALRRVEGPSWAD